MDSFFEKPSRDVPSERLDKWMRLRCCGDTERLGLSTRPARVGGTPGQDVRSATEAAGAANVVDGAPPGERGQSSNGWTTHRAKRVPKNRQQCCDQVAERKKPGAKPGFLLPSHPQRFALGATSPRGGETRARAANRGSTSRTTDRPGNWQRKRLGPCRDVVDRPRHGCANSRLGWRLHCPWIRWPRHRA